MKKSYIKPSIVIFGLASECVLVTQSDGNFGAGIGGDGEGTFDSKENGWEDFEITPLYDKTWGTDDNTLNEEE